MSEQIKPKAAIKFLREMEAYFQRNASSGEDSVVWAGVINSHNCARIADLIEKELIG